MKKTIWISALLLMFWHSANAGYDEKYRAYSGDFDSNGYTDLYLKRAPDVILIAGDVVTPVTTRIADGFILLQNADRTFSAKESLTSSELSVVNGWPESPVALTVRDINADGEMDLFIEGFENDVNFLPDTNELMVFAPNSSAVQTKTVDEEFRQFITQIHGWLKNKNYFENKAISNGWYDYQGEEQTGWWFISYINAYYSFDGGNSFLDNNDDPTDPGNIPAFCMVYPTSCWFSTSAGSWLVYGTFLANIVIVYDYSGFNQDAREFVAASGDAYHDPNAEISADYTVAEAIFERVLSAAVGNTAGGVLADPLPWPGLPQEPAPTPKPRQLPKPLPDAANDPNFGKKWGWRIISKVGIVVCGLLVCSEEVDPDEDEWLEWYHIGWEWALQDLLREEIDPDIDQVKVVIGEGEGSGQPYVRIPNAALEFGAVYFDLADENGNPIPFTSGQWSERTEKFLWSMNQGWIRSLMVIESLFYDIGLYGPRTNGRGKFYPCERDILGEYPWRQQVSFGGTSGWTPGPCELH